MRKKIAELQTAYNDPEISSDYARLGEISLEIENLSKELDVLMEEWEDLQLRIDESI